MSSQRIVWIGWWVVALLAAGPAWAEQHAQPSVSPEAQAILPLLDAKDAYVRQKAFLQLEALRDPATAPLVQGYLTSRTSSTRAFSVRALAAIDGVNAIPLLLERLQNDPSARVRVAAVLALEPLEEPRVLPALIGRLRDRKSEVRMAAVDAVSRVNHPDARAAILFRAKRERNRDVQRVLKDAVQRVTQPPQS